MTKFLAATVSVLLATGALAGCSPTTTPTESPTTPAISVTAVREVTAGQPGSSILGSPTNEGITINTLSSPGMQLVVNYGLSADALSQQSPVQSSKSGEPIVTQLHGLEPDSTYFYSVATSTGGAFAAAPAQSFVTSRARGSAFSFGVQGDSHPEREGKMFDSNMYKQNLSNVAAANLDFYIMMGDDFSIDKLIQDGSVSQESVNERYLLQREYLDALGASTPIFTVNGNHDEAAKFLLDGTTSNPAVYAGVARNSFFPLPSPGAFYSVDSTQVNGVGYLKDYYAFEWGDALFVVIDPYWHSDNAVDSSTLDVASGTNSKTSSDKKSSTKKIDSTATPKTKSKKHASGSPESNKESNTPARNLWDNTLGQDQYDWLVSTLTESTAEYKFVFTHHVLGTGRGGVEEASLFEWGGFDKNGSYAFPQMRPDWRAPIQELMAENNVTIFFQGHDHIFAQQELGGVTYQTVPCPADPTFTAFNRDAYTSGTVLPNSGYLNVTVDEKGVTVDYIATGGTNNGQSLYSYTVAPK